MRRKRSFDNRRVHRFAANRVRSNSEGTLADAERHFPPAGDQRPKEVKL